jgi:putative integral membrane protein (TIGR02587 family)
MAQPSGRRGTPEHASEDERGPWATEATDLVRAASGGLLFGIPLLYTMEIWWIGSHTSPLQTASVLGLTAVPLYLLNKTSGFRSKGTVRIRDAAMDTVEAVALGLVLVTIVLVLLREITGATPLNEALAKVVYEALPFCLGIGVANHFLRAGRDAGDDDADGDGESSTGGEDEADTSLHATLADLGATSIGAVFIALNIAPTDEVPMLVTAMTTPWILALVATSIATSYGIVFVAGFAGQDQRHSQVGVFQSPVTETIASYLVALAFAALMLALFQRLEGPRSLMLEQVVVLGFPAAIGGAAGRLAI